MRTTPVVASASAREADVRGTHGPSHRQSADDLYLVADVQGVVEGLRGGLCEVHATVGPDGDAVLVEGVAAVEEHRVRHRRVVELAAAVVKILPGHMKGSWTGRCAGL